MTVWNAEFSSDALLNSSLCIPGKALSFTHNDPQLEVIVSLRCRTVLHIDVTGLCITPNSGTWMYRFSSIAKVREFY